MILNRSQTTFPCDGDVVDGDFDMNLWSGSETARPTILPKAIANSFFLPRHLLLRAKAKDVPAKSAARAAPRASAKKPDKMECPQFDKILHANDGSKHSLNALSLSIALAKQSQSELHIVCVNELPYLPEFVNDVREAMEVAARRFREVLKRARDMAEESGVRFHTHIVAGHSVRDIVKLVTDIEADLLIIGARGHSALYERTIGSRASRITQLARCPVLVVK